MRTTTDHSIQKRSPGRGGPATEGPGTDGNRDGTAGRSPGGIAASVFRRVPGPLIGLVAVMVALSIMSPYFLTWRNLSNVITQNADIGIMAVGAALVILIGGIDLSVGSTLALSLMTSAWLYRSAGLPFELCVILGLTVGAAVGFINGVLSTYGRIQPFVATLATMSAAAGLALYLTNGNPINGFPEWYLAITSNDILGLPLEGIIMVATFLIAAYWLRFRPSGRALYAIGGNAEVARLSGLNVTRIKIGVYVVAGFLAALAGVIVGSRLDSAQPTAGTADLLNVIAVVVIGGASLSGGSGGMLNTFIGLLIIGVLNNGMSLLNVSPNLQQSATAAETAIAYEPVWAIGTGLTPSTGDVAEVHACLREALVKRFGPGGAAVRILYGGSVKPENARELMAVPSVNGALVGGASLKADDFLAIVAACGA